MSGWSPPVSVSVSFAAAAGLLLLVLAARRAATTPTARRWPLVLLRATVFALLLLILLNPVTRRETKLPPRLPEVALLYDGSRSMALEQQSSPLDGSSSQRPLRSYSNMAPEQPKTRLDRVKSATTEALRLTPAAKQPRLSYFRFGESLRAANGLAEIKADEDATNLAASLRGLAARLAGSAPAGVVVFSDGRATDGAELAEAADGFQRLGIKVHVFPAGDPRTVGDVAIEDVTAPVNAPAGARVPIRVLVRGKGFAGRRAELRVRSVSDPRRPPLALLPITLADRATEHDLVMTNDPAAGDLVVEVPPFADEAIARNNQAPLRIAARKSKIRVINMEGTTGNEWRWIHNALIEDPNIECLSMELNYQYTSEHQLHRVNDPQRGYPTTREELFTYNVVICSDIARTAFTPQQLDWTAELVSKRGGGFAMIGGVTSFGAGQWDQTVWDGLIPVDMTGASNQPIWSVQFQAKVPAALERHPVWRIVDDPIANHNILARMPPFFGTNRIDRLKPAAVALALADPPIPGVGAMPIFAAQSFGKGRTFAMSTDSTVNWGRLFESQWGEGDNRYFRKFWRNVVLWLAENSGSGSRRLRVTLDKVLYRPGQPIRVTAKAYDEKLEETTGYRLVARLRRSDAPLDAAGKPTGMLEEAALTGGPRADYQGNLTAPAARLLAPANAEDQAGVHRAALLDVIAYQGERIVASVTTEVRVLDDPVEFHEPTPDPAALEAIAATTGGTVLRSAGDLAKLLGSFPIGEGELVTHRSPRWDHPALLLAILALLAIDWSLRRWWGLA